MTLLEHNPIIRALLPVPRGMEDRQSILQQTDYESGFFKFPHDDIFGLEYFNPSLVDWKNNRWLITRRRRFTHHAPGRNDLVMWLLNGTSVSSPHPIKVHATYPDEHHEDPRAINRNGHAIISYCNFRKGSLAHICFGGLSEDFQIRQPVHLVYDGNGRNVMANTRHQKNWLPFIHDEKIHIVYQTYPNHEVLRTENGMVVKVWMTASQMPWQWGVPRGGTPPVRVGNEYWTFFHSSLPWRKFKDGSMRNRYYMGALAFDVGPPFKILRISRKPILAGSEYDRRNNGAPVCVFPGGAILENGTWFIVGGCNDCCCFWIKIPHDSLVGTLTSQ